MPAGRPRKGTRRKASAKVFCLYRTKFRTRKRDLEVACALKVLDTPDAFSNNDNSQQVAGIETDLISVLDEPAASTKTPSIHQLCGDSDRSHDEVLNHPSFSTPGGSTIPQAGGFEEAEPLRSSTPVSRSPVQFRGLSPTVTEDLPSTENHGKKDSTSETSTFPSEGGVFRVTTMLLANDDHNDDPVNIVKKATSAETSFKHQETCEYQESISALVQKFFSNVKRHIMPHLPKHWIALDSNDGVSLIMMSPSPDLIVAQRSVIICADGVVKIAMHSKSLAASHELWGRLPPSNPSTFASVCDFAQHAIKIVNLINLYEVCPGCKDPNEFDIVKKVKNARYDSNVFHESAYSTTYRSASCDMLITRPTPKSAAGCKHCVYLRRLVRQRKFRRPNLDKTVHIKTPNIHIPTPQRKRKMNAAAETIKNGSKREKYLRAKVKYLIEQSKHTVKGKLNEDLATCLASRDSGDIAKALGLEKLTAVQEIFIKEQLKAASLKNPCGMRWHPVMIRLALRIQMASPKQYDALSGILHLPSSRTLYDYSHANEVREGIDWAAINDLAKEMKKYDFDSHRQYHSLLIDEMQISKNLVYNKATGELVGFVKLDEVSKETMALDHALKMKEAARDSAREEKDRLLSAEERQDILKKREQWEKHEHVVPEISEKILVMMVRGITNGIKQTVACYGVKNLTPESLYRKMWDVISHLETEFISVLNVTCDGHPMNRTMMKLHQPYIFPDGTKGVTTVGSVPYAVVNLADPQRPLYFISDAPHLLKTIRNSFYNSGCGERSRFLRRNNQFILWSLVKELYEDEVHSEIRMAHKLNAQKVYLNTYAKMKVSYAAQVMSRTVANAIVDMKYPDSEETVNFIIKVNDFFDCLNGYSTKEGIHKRNDNLLPYTSVDDPRFKDLEGFKDYILDWKANSSDQRQCIATETITGIELTILSFTRCVKFLLSEKGAEFVMARPFCQDPLEETFSKLRHCTGGSAPNVAMALSGLNRLRMLKTVPFKTNGNTQQEKDSIDMAALSTPLPKRKPGRGVEHRCKKVRRILSEDVGFARTKNQPRQVDCVPSTSSENIAVGVVVTGAVE